MIPYRLYKKADSRSGITFKVLYSERYFVGFVGFYPSFSYSVFAKLASSDGSIIFWWVCVKILVKDGGWVLEGWFLYDQPNQVRLNW